MNTLLRCWLFQRPAIVILGLVLMLIVHYLQWISLPMALILWLGWILKDALLYPLVRPAYVMESRHGTDQLIGLHGEVTRALQPEGYIRVRGELWRARLFPSDNSGSGKPSDASDARRGARVRVMKADGMLLLVVPADAPISAARSNASESGTPTPGTSESSDDN